MIKITVLYGHPKNPQEFERYYADKHMPLAATMKDVSRIELTQFGPGLDGGSPAYYRMAEGYFATERDMQSTLSSPEGQATVADLPKFASGGVTMLVGSVAN